jgi:hypothetical protein
MAEDALCTHEPGTFKDAPLLRSPQVVYGAGGGNAATSASVEPVRPIAIAWDDAARDRIKKIPALVRGVVTRAVEDSCRKEGRDRVTLEVLDAIRARMPVPKVFRPS